MKKLVLITVLLQLCLSVLDVNASSRASAGEPGELVEENQLQFGDLLVSSYTKEKGKTFSHYAVYVGDEPLEGKKDKENIFEMTNNPPGCQFLEKNGSFRRHNYLDKSKQPQSKQNMILTIQELMQKDVCKTYSLTKANCEQIATKVRYGESSCKQKGTNTAPLAKFLKNPRLKRHDASAAA